VLMFPSRRACLRERSVPLTCRGSHAFVIAVATPAASVGAESVPRGHVTPVFRCVADAHVAPFPSVASRRVLAFGGSMHLRRVSPDAVGLCLRVQIVPTTGTRATRARRQGGRMAPRAAVPAKCLSRTSSF
jgi:hypothetical protein